MMPLIDKWGGSIMKDLSVEKMHWFDNYPLVTCTVGSRMTEHRLFVCLFVCLFDMFVVHVNANIE